MECKWSNYIFISYEIIAVFSYVNGQLTVKPPDEACFQCICEMATGCNLTFGCNSEQQCGPFRMTEPFWVDAGKKVLHLDDPKTPGAFSRCANDPFCARLTTESYFQTFAQDCNTDGIIDCKDYAILHQHGCESCENKSLTTEQTKILKNCLRKN